MKNEEDKLYYHRTLYAGGGFPLVPVFLERVAEVPDKQNSSKILRIEITCHDNGNVLDRTSMDINLFNTKLLDKI
jgi:hypothetical protein